MESEQRVFLTYDEAVGMLPDGDTIHTFRSGTGILLGVDHPRKSLLEKLKAHKIELSGQLAKSMNHGIALIDDNGPLFIETNKGEMK